MCKANTDRAAALAKSTREAKEAIENNKKKKEKESSKGNGRKKSLKKGGTSAATEDSNKNGSKKSLVAASAAAAASTSSSSSAASFQNNNFSPTTAMCMRRRSSSETEAEPAIEGFATTSKKNDVTSSGKVATSCSTPNLSEVNGDKKRKDGEQFSPAFKEGNFFTRVDPSTLRGHLRVRDGSRFETRSMYRKRDKYSKHGSAVALLVGREEQCKDERVIEVLFDTEQIKEKEAWSWWKENKERFMSPTGKN